MPSNNWSHQKAPFYTTALLACTAMLAACGAQSTDAPAASEEPAKTYTQADLDAVLADPAKRGDLIVKIMGDTAGGETHKFLKFHVYGYPGDGNLIPFFTMNNYIVQKWTPTDEPGVYDMQHYEVAYYSEFDTTTPLENWVNPISGEVNEVPTFILGPIERTYTPDGVIAMGLGPQPMQISLIGDRVFIPTQSIEAITNRLQPEEWGQYSSGPITYWDSMMTFSAKASDVFDETKTKAPAVVQMQNLISWGPFFELGQRPGRTMVRAFGTHVSGPEELDPVIRGHLEEFAPAIFNTDEWTELRIDTLDYLAEIQEKIDAGEVVIEPPMDVTPG